MRMGSHEARRPDNTMRRAVQARDAGLRKISSVTRWVIAGAVGLSGALALIAANSFHGRTIQSSPSSQTPSSQQLPASTPAPSSTAAEAPQAPQQAPVQTPAQPAVVSGGS